MHINPFDHAAGQFSVVVNAEEQHSLGAAAAEVPAGWRIVFGEATRAQCLDYVVRNWADMRPRSLREAIG